MRFLSVCSGIEAASVAWNPLGWEAVAFSEVEPFPCAVLAHHYPNVPNCGDLTKWEEWNVPKFDVLCGGTPCQGFSVAGRRGGMDDPRSQLAWDFCGIAGKHRPRWVVWENVPGVLSSNQGEDFRSFVQTLSELGYGVCWRVLDAQYFGLAQRRKRVFVVGYLGDWRPAAAVLLEPESLRGDSPPSRETGEETAADVVQSLTGSGRGAERTGESRGQDPVVAFQCQGSNVGPMGTLRGGNGNEAGGVPFTIHGTGKTQKIASETDVAGSLRTKPPGSQENSSTTVVAHPLRAEGHDASEDGTGRGVPLTAASLTTHAGSGGFDLDTETPVVCRGRPDNGQLAGTLTARLARGLGYDNQDLNSGLPHLVSDTVVSKWSKGSGGPAGHEHQNLAPPEYTDMAVRRLTPTECARLQGFPDDYLDITYRGKPAADGPKYKALGNSWAVPVVRWIGRRLADVHAALGHKAGSND